MSTKITKKQAQQFVDMLNDLLSDYRITIPTIPVEEAREMNRSELNRRIKQVLGDVLGALK